MDRTRPLFLPLLLLSLAALPADAEGVRVSSEQAWIPATHTPRALSRQNNLLEPAELQLPPLSTLEKSRIKRADRKGQRRYQIGLGRPMPRSGAIPDLHWQSDAQGRLQASLHITSPGALGLRVCLSATGLPDQARVAFLDPSGDGAGFSAITGAQLREARGEDQRCYWSPALPGEAVRIQITLPAGTDLTGVRPRVEQVSHLYHPLPGDRRLSEVGDSGFCENDIQCFESSWGVTADSVAKYLFTDTLGITYLCTGQLLNDLDTSTQIPWFLTAEHCISHSSEAATAQFYWFFERTSCGGSTPSSVIQTGGGAELLSHGAATDYALLRLVQPPPAGVIFTGWASQTITPGDAGTGIHHPQGDVKKISFGTINGLAREGLPASSGAGNFLQTLWHSGVTEAGSSGSGLWIEANGQQYLVGTLSSGVSSCSFPAGADWYSRFDLTFKNIESFVATPRDNGPAPGDAIPDTQGVRVPSYRLHTDDGRFFYTTSLNEADQRLTVNPNWGLDGVAFYVYDGMGTQLPADAVPIYRLNSNTAGYLYTGSENEKAAFSNHPDFNLEGIAFYAFPAPATGRQPVYRFSMTQGGWFFTSSEVEKVVFASITALYHLDGVAFYTPL